MKLVTLRPEAADDLLAARDWYDRRRAGLGDRFSAAVSVVLDRVAAMPEAFRVRWRDVRACRLHRYPYIVYYRILEDRIEVLAVLHGSRDASAWRTRA